MTKIYRLLLISVFVSLFWVAWLHSNEKKLDDIGVTPGLSAQLIPLDSQYSSQKKSLSNIQLEAAWDLTTGSREIIVAIIDDAIDVGHPDLAGNIIMAEEGHDFVDGDDDPSPGLCLDPVTQTETLEQHGTQVAGIIGAVGNNSLGIAGVNWQVKIMPLRIGCYYPANLETQAVQWAIDHGADIINASYGGPERLARNEKVIQLLKNAQKKVLFVTAAGNFHVNNDELPVYPGNSGLANVITVSAANDKKELTEWTQYGASSVDLSAPGVDLQTTIKKGSGYTSASGSSFSTAVVSGVAALVKSYDFNQTLTPLDLKAVLQASVSIVEEQNARNKTSGLINARAALDLLASPQPVLTVVDVKYSDDGENFPNGLIDANEFGKINIELENLWVDIVAGTISISVEDPTIQLSTSFFNLSPLAAGERRVLSVPIQISEFNGHRRFRFHLAINLSGSNNKNALYKRSFEIQSGMLINNIQERANIQQNKYDDYRYYHLNIPKNSDRVAVELEYDVSDTRDMGLLADFDKRPLIHFRAYNGKAYSASAKYSSDNRTGYERIDIRVPVTQQVKQNSSLKIMIFNQPSRNPLESFKSNKSYKLKGCFFSDTDGNAAPIVNAGADRRVNAGETVTLTGEVADRDGEITRYFWQSSNGVAFVVLNDNQIQFTAPTSGEYTFSLVAIDNECKKTVDYVTISVSDVNGNVPEGLILNPQNLTIDESSGFDVLVSAVYNSREVADLTMIVAPNGVKYANGIVSWKNAGPKGVHLIKFSAKVDNQTLFGTIRVEIIPRTVGNGGGGCVAVKNANFDPLFLLYILLSSFFIFKKMVFRNKKA